MAGPTAHAYMDLRDDDDRRYSLVTQRIVQITRHARKGSPIAASALVETVLGARLREFYLETRAQYMSAARTRDYLNFLAHIQVFEYSSDKKTVTLLHEKPSTQRQWATFLSDQTWAALAAHLDCKPGEVAKELISRISKILKDQALPTTAALADALSIESTTEQERLRWLLYVYTDGPDCELRFLRPPVLMKR